MAKQVQSPGINGRGGAIFEIESRGPVIRFDQELASGRRVDMDLRPREAFDLGLALIEQARPYIKTKNRTPLYGDEDEEVLDETVAREEVEPRVERHGLRQKRTERRATN